MVLTIVSCPFHVDCVCQDWGELTQGSDVYWPERLKVALSDSTSALFHSKPDGSSQTNIGKILPGRPLWLHIWFVCRNWVGQGAHFAVNLDAD